VRRENKKQKKNQKKTWDEEGQGMLRIGWRQGTEEEEKPSGAVAY